MQNSDIRELEPYNQKEVAEAFEVIKNAMISDFPEEPGSYAHSWHCNIAMAFYDAANEDPNLSQYSSSIRLVANKAASRFMKTLFDVETRQ